MVKHVTFPQYMISIRNCAVAMFAKSSESDVHMEPLRLENFSDSEDSRDIDCGNELRPAPWKFVDTLEPRSVCRRRGFAERWFFKTVAVFPAVVALSEWEHDKGHSGGQHAEEADE